MNILIILLVIVAVGLVVYLVNKFLPLDPTIKLIFYIVAVGGLIWWLLDKFGVLQLVGDVKVGDASLLALLLIILLVGLLLWLVERFIPMEANIKRIFEIVCIVGLIIYLVVSVTGIGPSIGAGIK